MLSFSVIETYYSVVSVFCPTWRYYKLIASLLWSWTTVTILKAACSLYFIQPLYNLTEAENRSVLASYVTLCCLQGSLLEGRSTQFILITSVKMPLLLAVFWVDGLWNHTSFLKHVLYGRAIFFTVKTLVTPSLRSLSDGAALCSDLQAQSAHLLYTIN